MKKHKCAGCKALDMASGQVTCKLGYELDFYSVNDWLKCPKPKTECPKPLTYVEYFAAAHRHTQAQENES